MARTSTLGNVNIECANKEQLKITLLKPWLTSLCLYLGLTVSKKKKTPIATTTPTATKKTKKKEDCVYPIWSF